MTFENIQEIIAKDEHRCLELKKTTGELQDGLHSACAWRVFVARIRMSLWTVAERKEISSI